MDDFRFDRDTSVEPTGDGSFSGQVHERWTIEKVPNGGYVMAMMLRAGRAVSNHPDPLSVTAHFLSPTVPGPIEISSQVVKAGRSTTVLMLLLAQEGRERVRMLATFGTLDRDGPSASFLAPPELAGPFESERSLLVQEFSQNFEYRIPASVAGGALGRPTGEPEIGGTIAFADGRPPDVLALPVFADGFAPVAFNLGYMTWTPTLELTVHFWNHPAAGPVTVWLHTDVLEGGYHDESADLWDSDGKLVARSRQLALILEQPG